MVELNYGYRLTGRRRIRIREVHLRDQTAVLLHHKASGAAKLDLVLRGLARSNAANGVPGAIPTGASWEALHDLCRQRGAYIGAQEVKRQWTREQLHRLEKMKLLRRMPGGPWNRPQVIVLKGDGSEDVIDDPSGLGSDSYVTVSGWVIAGGWLSRWGAPELAAYLAAMIAERYARADAVLSEVWQLEKQVPGTGKWYRPLNWFADSNTLRPDHHVRIPFSERTLRRGFKSLIKQDLVSSYLTTRDPRTGDRFSGGPRTIYTNHFNKLKPLHLHQGRLGEDDEEEPDKSGLSPPNGVSDFIAPLG